MPAIPAVTPELPSIPTIAVTSETYDPPSSPAAPRVYLMDEDWKVLMSDLEVLKARTDNAGADSFTMSQEEIARAEAVAHRIASRGFTTVPSPNSADADLTLDAIIERSAVARAIEGVPALNRTCIELLVAGVSGLFGAAGSTDSHHLTVCGLPPAVPESKLKLAESVVGFASALASFVPWGMPLLLACAGTWAYTPGRHFDGYTHMWEETKNELQFLRDRVADNRIPLSEVDAVSDLLADFETREAHFLESKDLIHKVAFPAKWFDGFPFIEIGAVKNVQIGIDELRDYKANVLSTSKRIASLNKRLPTPPEETGAQVSGPSQASTPGSGDPEISYFGRCIRVLRTLMNASTQSYLSGSVELSRLGAPA